ncbi:NtaA/DmoA family FMN-dependent monooxygenase [Pseudonocardia endophytica]|uniref:FMN-dependent oxidoreductase (Nitrilotriacetate monooxygenase family) n=1 Tax=Pseudonocardia endophytica TaxID=401976 RepID=A0A4R1HVL0_PSEEN|nr:NtaA/DmoA family FMN-dependent monooxygenase [Pseudonocardia endophytica]TCK26318.1 FMN-dependent oxidoreductase (nitrilotriacetate monooxygenase family) [Pseudonocardia endophytica]
MTRELHLNVNITDAGKHAAAWRKQPDPRSFLDIGYFQHIGRVAEAARLDAIFLSDYPALTETTPTKPWQSLDPTIVLSAVAAVTEHIGLIGTASTTFNHPYALARRFASLDHVSRGRIAWNIVTTMHPAASAAYGHGALPDRDQRYAQAEEFVAATAALWASWDADALVADQEAGTFARGGAVHPVALQGRYPLVGALNVPRGPQGRPVLVQAGSSEGGRTLAGRWADVVFTAQTTLPEAAEFYADINARARAHGRPDGSVVVLPGLFPVVGSTEAEALARLADLNEHYDYDREHARLAAQLGVGVEEIPLDRPLDPRVTSGSAVSGSSQGFLDATVRFAVASGWTIRQLIDRNGGAHRMVVGTPEQIADDIELWFTERAADGFNLNIDVLPDGLERVVEHVVPELRRRGIFRSEYAHRTLRGNLGLPAEPSDPVPLGTAPRDRAVAPA